MTSYQGLQLGMPTVGGNDINYLLRVEFTRDDTPPFSDPYYGEVGALKPTDSNARLYTETNVLKTLANSDGLLTTGCVADVLSRSRVAGRAMIWVHKHGSQNNQIKIAGWSTNQLADQITHGFRYTWSNNNTIDIQAAANSLVYSGYNESLSTDYEYTSVLQNLGALFFVKGGAFTNRTLLFVSDVGASTPLYPVMNSYSSPSSNGQDSFDFLHTYDLPSPYTTDYSLATFTNQTFNSGDVFTGTADAIHLFRFTLNGSPSANDEVSLYYRGNDTNGWKAFLKRNAGNTAWDFRVRTVTASVESTPSGWTDVTGVGTPTGIEISVQGSQHRFYTATSTGFTPRGNLLNVSHQDTIDDMKIIAATGTTLTRLSNFPKTDPVFDNFFFGVANSGAEGFGSFGEGF